MTPATLAKLTAGLKRVQVQSLISQAVENQQPLTLKFLTQRKKELIEAESGGLAGIRAEPLRPVAWWPATTPPRRS